MLTLVTLGVLVVATDPDPKADVAPHGIEGRFGMSAFAGGIGGESLTALGLHVGLERRLADGVQLGIEGGYLGMSDPEQRVDWRGRMSRAAIVARFALIETDEVPVMGAWVDVGLGVERITWERGGVLLRPELMVGLSGTVGGVFGGKGADRAGRFGDFFQVRMLVSRGPGCAGMMCPTEMELGLQIATGFYFSE